MPTTLETTAVPLGFEGRLSEPRPCKRCGAPIRYLRTKNGKSAPVDAKPVTLREADVAEGLSQGRRLLDREGSNRLHEAGETGFVSHFATCPHADAFRKASGRSRAPKRLNEASPSNVLRRVRYIAESLRRIEGRTKGRLDVKRMKSEIKLLVDYAEKTAVLMEEVPS